MDRGLVLDQEGRQRPQCQGSPTHQHAHHLQPVETPPTIEAVRGTNPWLLDVSDHTDDTFAGTARHTAEALRRRWFVLRVREDYDALRSDREAWAEYMAEAESTHVIDGIVSRFD